VDELAPSSELMCTDTGPPSKDTCDNSELELQYAGGAPCRFDEVFEIVFEISWIYAQPVRKRELEI
jgi:hypothetical protein